MTHNEWLSSTDAFDLLTHLHVAGLYPGERKLLLFGAALLWSDRPWVAWLPERAALSIHALEDRADGRGVSRNYWLEDDGTPRTPNTIVIQLIHRAKDRRRLNSAIKLAPFSVPDANVLRGMVNDPFAPAGIPEAVRLDADVQRLAGLAYGERPHLSRAAPDAVLDPDVLNVLADALIDAGLPAERTTECPSCDGLGGYNEIGPNTFWQTCRACGGEKRKAVADPTLARLRSPQPHYRGDFALDLILGLD